MDSPITPDTEQRIRALCDEIAVAYDLDAELREELRGHVEDKMLGYLSGDEAVTEPDAFILAREHFGDRKRLKAMLSDVHHVEASVSLWRRMAAISVVTLSLGLLFQFLMPAVQALLALTGQQVSTLARLVVAHAVGDVAWVAAAWWFVARWRRGLARGRRLWFVRCSPWVLGAVNAGLLAVYPLTSTASIHLWRWSVSLAPAAVQSQSAWNYLVVVSGHVSVVAIVAAWLWWCDTRPRRWGVLIKAALAWALLMFVTSALSAVVAYQPEVSVEGASSAVDTSGGEIVPLGTLRSMSTAFFVSARYCLYAAFGLLVYCAGSALAPERSAHPEVPNG